MQEILFCQYLFTQTKLSQESQLLNCFALDRDADCNEDDKGEGEDGEEDGKDDVGLLLNLLCSCHLANCGVAQHQDELETVEKI